MAKTAILMKAPEGVHTANILGHEYDIPKSGVIRVISETHIETLVRHGFENHFEEEENVADKIAAMTDKDELVTFIEERGGDADSSFALRKLRRIALELVTEE